MEEKEVEDVSMEEEAMKLRMAEQVEGMVWE